MEIPYVNSFLQIQDGGIQHGCIVLELSISHVRINLDSGYFICYESMYTMELVELPSVTYF